MSSEKTSLIKRIAQEASGGSGSLDVFIPIANLSIFSSLIREIGDLIVKDPGSEMTVVVDSGTLKACDGLDSACSGAERFVVFGNDGAASDYVKGVEIHALDEGYQDGDRFLAVLSSVLSFVLVGNAGDSGNADDFVGAWTGLRARTKSTIDFLLKLGCAEPLESMPGQDSGEAERSLEYSASLTGMIARHFESLQRDASMDKDDLITVLEILKAISAKRRAHDILYVFVREIAHAVHMDRCSIVRVWGGERTGHVLASHEDETVSDLEIDLEKYPELTHSLANRERVVVNDMKNDPLTKKFAKDFEDAVVSSLIVIPIVLFDENVGSLFLRAAREKKTFRPREISFCEIVAEAAANALERAHLFESIQKANKRLEHLAVTDGLTGLYNHRFIRERLDDEFERAKRYKVSLSCMIIDVDDFKKLNDTYGHLQGDSVLREVASRMLSAIRNTDIVARYGGEEFIVIMPQTGKSGALAEAERLRRRIGDYSFEGLPPDGGCVTVTVGVGIFNEKMLNADCLVSTADSALYEGKRSGKNRSVVGVFDDAKED